MPRTLRRMVFDLTPLIDLITILLFGVMINSVQLIEADTARFRLEAEQATHRSQADRKALIASGERVELLADVNAQLKAQLAEAKDLLARSESERATYARQLQEQKLGLAQVFAKLLQLNDPERLTFQKRLDEVSGAGAEKLKEIAATLQSETEPSKVYRAVRRIEEMQKVFTFIDLHIDDHDFLSVIANARQLERFPVRDRPQTQIENEVRRALESENFNQMVLVLFSYDGSARDLTVEKTEAAINALLTHYRSLYAGQNRHFRYGRVGLVTLPPVILDEKGKVAP